MATIQVRDLPEDVYARLTLAAKEEHRSLAQETIVLLKRALDSREERKRIRHALLRRIREKKPPQDVPSPVELLREDRRR